MYDYECFNRPELQRKVHLQNLTLPRMYLISWSGNPCCLLSSVLASLSRSPKNLCKKCFILEAFWRDSA